MNTNEIISASAAGYPEWHNNPMLLSLTDMSDPMAVLTAFFARYSLPDIRACMGLWLADALEGGADAGATLHLHNEVMAVLEAVWMMVKR